MAEGNPPSINQAKPTSVRRIEIDKLFGYLTYAIPQEGWVGTGFSRLMMLYGDNGCGKTTILRLLFSLLSTRRNQGDKSWVSQTPFKRFAIFFDDGTSGLPGGGSPSHFVVFTDYSCLECYALSERTLNKFCALYLGKNIDPARMLQMLSILRELFLLRAAKTALSRGAHWIDDFTRCCAAADGKIVFDRESLIERLANASGGWLNRDELHAKTLELQEGTPRDIRDFINGHDLIRMLSWFAHQIGVPQAICDRAPLQRALITSIRARRAKEYASVPEAV